MALENDIEKCVRDHAGSVSFIELRNQVKGVNGEFGLIINTDKVSNICLWPSLSTECCAALLGLMARKAIHYRPASPLVYWHDGSVPKMPIAKGLRHYKQLHWIPVTWWPDGYRENI